MHQGLLIYLGPDNRNPYIVFRGSNHKFSNVECPNCSNVFSNNQSIAKVLRKTRGRCMKRGLCVKDIHEENNPMVKWYPKIKSEKTSRQGTTHVTVWNCPFLLR